MTKIIFFIVVIGAIFASGLISRGGSSVKTLIQGMNENFLSYLEPEILALFIIAFIFIFITLIQKIKN